MQIHESFEWDAKKARQSQSKHKIAFNLAAAVLADSEGDVYLLEEPDDAHSQEEDRFTTIGSLPGNRRIILRITWTERRAGKRRITRILSARRANKKEIAQYAKQIGNR